MDLENNSMDLVTQKEFCLVDLEDAQRKKDENIFLKMDWDLHFSNELSTMHANDPPTKSEPKVNAVFRWNANAENVFLSGSFDDWNTTLPLAKSRSEFFTIIELPQGRHEYRFLVDGEWKVDINEPVVSGPGGYQSNVLTIMKSDCEVFDALMVDDCRLTGISLNPSDSKWTQEIPPRGSGYTFMRSGPPFLPPHLSNTILNEETPQHCDPTILMQPTHVVLNHLYTLSIKDGVLVMGTTYRYRKKYITAILYKPI